MSMTSELVPETDEDLPRTRSERLDPQDHELNELTSCPWANENDIQNSRNAGVREKQSKHSNSKRTPPDEPKKPETSGQTGQNRFVRRTSPMGSLLRSQKTTNITPWVNSRGVSFTRNPRPNRRRLLLITTPHPNSYYLIHMRIHEHVSHKYPRTI